MMRTLLLSAFATALAAPDICAAHAPQLQPESETPAVYQSLNKFDVQLDKVVEARGYPTRQVHVFVTIRNATATAQYITSGFMRAILTDTDGVGLERNQVWRATDEPAALFDRTPVIRAGAELKIRYVFTPAEGAIPATFTLIEGGKTIYFPVTGF